MTQPGQPGSTASRTATAPNSAGGGILGRPGFMGGLFAGFLGAGLLGMLIGHGFAGGLGGMASMLGLLLQIGIVALIGYLVWTWWQRRSQPAMASGPMLRDYGRHDFAADRRAAAWALRRRLRCGSARPRVRPAPTTSA